MSLMSVPVGFRFDPTEVELACHYLLNKVMGRPLSCPQAVPHYDLYGSEEPWQIWEKFGGYKDINPTIDDEDDGDDNEDAGPSPQNDLFFYTTLKKINPNSESSKFERRVGSNGGRWHGDNVHTFSFKGITWNRRRYCYKNPNIDTTDHASWIMLEYSLDDKIMHKAPHYTVLCRIRRKNKNNNCSRKRKSAQSNPQPKPKRQLKNMKPKTRTPLVEESVLLVAAPPPHYPDQYVALSENMSKSYSHSCFSEEQIKTINCHSTQEYFLKNFDIGDDRSLVDCEQQQHHVALPVYAAPNSILLQETTVDGVDINFEDCRPIHVLYPQLRYRDSWH